MQSMEQYSTVTIDAKVLHIEDLVQLLDGRSKQDLRISDGTQYVKLKLWEQQIPMLPSIKSHTLPVKKN